MNYIKKFLCGLLVIFGAFVPDVACAWGIIPSADSLDISGLIPIIISSFMNVATGSYEYFVGHNRDGIIFLLVWGFLAFYIALYLVKLYIPKFWLSTFGFKSGDSINDVTGMKITENVVKPSGGCYSIIFATANNCKKFN